VDANRQELLMSIHRNMAALQLEIERYRNLLSCVLDGNMNEAGLLQMTPRLEENRREPPLREVLQEAITILDESRRAFKSKKLEILRKRLTQALAEC